VQHQHITITAKPLIKEYNLHLFLHAIKNFAIGIIPEIELRIISLSMI